jgi:preprotein translocase subunit SecE
MANVHCQVFCAALQALSDTLVVIAIVAGTAVSLFAVNTVLADISKQIY